MKSMKLCGTIPRCTAPDTQFDTPEAGAGTRKHADESLFIKGFTYHTG